MPTSPSTLVLFNRDDAHWGSVKTIAPNIVQVYKSLTKSHQIDFLPFSINEFAEDIRFGNNFSLKLAEQIKKVSPQKIVITYSHYKIPTIMETLCRLLPDSNFEWIVHVYGDFTIAGINWTNSQEVLKGQKITFVCASDRQKQLLMQYLPKNMGDIKIAPFPVDAAQFSFRSDWRLEERGRLKLGKKDHLLLYTGRLSLQKGILPLLDIFHSLAKKDPHLHLLMAGSYDDIGASMLGLNNLPGYFFWRVQQVLEELPKDIRQRIHIPGPQSLATLKKLYCAADCFVSLSLYHDEDYGMSVAESLCAGLPTVITDWGGFSSFAVNGTVCELIPVDLEDEGFSLPVEKIKSALAKACSSNKSDAQRIQCGKVFANQFGFEGCKPIYASLLKNPAAKKFNGFSHRLREFAMQAGFPLIPSKQTRYSEFYYPYYSSRKDKGI